MLGDVNNDGKVDSSDYALLRRYILGISSDLNLTVADLNGDSTVNSTDAALLKRVLLGLK